MTSPHAWKSKRLLCSKSYNFSGSMRTDIHTGIMCKNCGYEITLMNSWNKVELYHTGVEEHLSPNRFCAMVHWDDTGIPLEMLKQDTKAEMRDDDLESFIKNTLNSVVTRHIKEATEEITKKKQKR